MIASVGARKDKGMDVAPGEQKQDEEKEIGVGMDSYWSMEGKKGVGGREVKRGGAGGFSCGIVVGTYLSFCCPMRPRRLSTRST